MDAFVLCSLAAMATAARATSHSWLAPSSLFAAVWFAAAAVPAIFSPDYNYSSSGQLYLVAMVAAFAIGSFVASHRHSGTIDDFAPFNYLDEPTFFRIERVATAGGAAGVTAAMYTLIINDISISALLSPARLFESGGIIVRSDTVSLVPSALMGLAYVGAAAAPYLILKPESSRLLIAFPTIGSLFYTVVTTQRLGFLTCSVLTIGGYIAARSMRQRNPVRLSPRMILAIFLALSSIAVIFSAVAFVRVGNTSAAQRPVIWKKLQVYATGYLPAFTTWYEAESGRSPLSFGTSTFDGFFGPLRGGTGSTKGLERIDISRDGVFTNVYTAQRSLIEDFGTAGSLMFTSVVGFAATRAYQSRSTIFRYAYGIWVAWVLLSPTQSLFVFSNISWAVLGAAIIVRSQVRPAGRSRNPTGKSAPSTPRPRPTALDQAYLANYSVMRRTRDLN